MLAMSDVTVTRGGRNLLDEVTIRCQPGRVTVLLGPNGAGKSTALTVLAGDIAPDRGEATINGEPVRAVPPPVRARQRAVLSQSIHMPFAYQAFSVVELGARFTGGDLPDPAIAVLVADAMAEADTAHLAERDIRTLSGGERQRVHIARVLAQLRASLMAATPQASKSTPRYLLMDEPVTGLDLKHQRQIMRIARRVADEGHGVLAVLHDLNLAAAYGDHLVLLSEGRVAAEGGATDILQHDILNAVYDVEVQLLTHPETGAPAMLL